MRRQRLPASVPAARGCLRQQAALARHPDRMLAAGWLLYCQELVLLAPVLVLAWVADRLALNLCRPGLSEPCCQAVHLIRGC